MPNDKWRKRHAKPASFVAETTSPLFGRNFTCEACGKPVAEAYVDINRAGARKRRYWHRYCNPARAADALLAVEPV